ncbi:anti-sigma factor family protein, partial [Pyxidicoccus sp. 3LG]
MSPQCNKLYLFLDGELGPVDEENFRHHLARCELCASGLHEALQLEMLSLQALRDVNPPVPSLVEEPDFDVPMPAPAARAPARLPRPLRALPRARWMVGAAVALAALMVA